MKYSFVVPVKNINSYIRESIPKILEIKRDDFEILIYPDKATNETWSKTRQIASGHCGPAEKRRLALKDALGDFLIFIDDDAYPEKNILDILDQDFKNEFVAAVGGPASTPKSDSFLQKVSGAFFLSSLSGGFPERYLSIGKKRFVKDWPSVNLTVRKSIFCQVGGFDSQYWPGEDTKFCLDVIEKINKNNKILYDPEVIAWLSFRLSACTNKSSENRCLNGYYSGYDDGTYDFGAGNTDRYVGYSEMLYWILKGYPAVYADNLTISGTVFGGGKYPSLAWVDGFVINNNTDPKKIDQAIRFIDFYNSPEVREIIALSLDTKGNSDRVPRYLLPATEDFYTLPNVSADPYYRQFYPIIQNMTPFPTGGLRGNMDAVFCSVTSALYREGMDVNCNECRYACDGSPFRGSIFSFGYRSHTDQIQCACCGNPIPSQRFCFFRTLSNNAGMIHSI